MKKKEKKKHLILCALKITTELVHSDFYLSCLFVHLVFICIFFVYTVINYSLPESQYNDLTITKTFIAASSWQRFYYQCRLDGNACVLDDVGVITKIIYKSTGICAYPLIFNYHWIFYLILFYKCILIWLKKKYIYKHWINTLIYRFIKFISLNFFQTVNVIFSLN